MTSRIQGTMVRTALLALLFPLLSACGSDDVSTPSNPIDSSIDSVGDSVAETSDAIAETLDTSDTTAPTTLVLPGDKYYPESLHAASDGTLYVGSLGTGQVVKFAPGSTTSTTFLAGGDPKGVSGVLVDSTASTLWLCAVDLTTTPPTTEVRSYDLATATKKASFGFSKPAFCNDLVLDSAGNLFVSDSFGSVWQLKKGATALAEWKSDALLAPSTATGFGADGIVVDAKSVWVNTFSDGRLLQIAINGDGTAGALTQIAVTPALKTPDGMRMLDASTLVVADGTAGTITKIAIAGTSGTSSTIASGLNGPTSLVKVGSKFWVTEGQLGHLTGALPGAPTLPFDVRSVPAS